MANEGQLTLSQETVVSGLLGCVEFPTISDTLGRSTSESSLLLLRGSLLAWQRGPVILTGVSLSSFGGQNHAQFPATERENAMIPQRTWMLGAALVLVTGMLGYGSESEPAVNGSKTKMR